MPLFSICIAAYNVASYIEACIKSVLSQDYGDYEVILADNGSSDSTPQICQEYAHKHPERIRFIRLESPTRPVRAHIRAVKEARGDYIHLIDGDDCVAENYLCALAEIIKERRPELLMGRFQCVLEPGASNYMDCPIDKNRINCVDTRQAVDYIYSLPYINLFVWRFVAARRLIPLIDLPEDTAYLVPVDGFKTNIWLLNARSIYYYDGPFYYYRRRIGSTVLSKNNAFTMDILKLCFRAGSLAERIVGAGPEQETWKYQKLKRQLCWYFRMFLADADCLTREELEETADCIDREISHMQLPAPLYPKEFLFFLDLAKRHGGHEGLKRYLQKTEELLLALLESGKREGFYLFPSGKYARNTCRILKRNRIPILGFLDNDPLKENTVMDGSRCCLPETLIKEDGANCRILVTSMYGDVNKSLIRQLRSLGICEEQIFVRRFGIL